MPHDDPPSLPDPSAASPWDAALGAVLATSAFLGAHRHRQLLAYLVACARSGEAGPPKEAAIAIDVFGRDPAHYDPRRDAIVRVELARLRKRLAKAQGELPPTVEEHIDIPLGAYAPVLSLRSTAVTGDPPASPLNLAVAALHPQRLALLPVSQGPDVDGAAAGALRQALLLRFGTVAALRVVSGQHNPHLSMAGAPAPLLAHRLNAELLLEVHLLRHGGRWDARVRLVRGREGLQIVAREVEGPSQRGADGIEDLARDIVAVVRPWLSLQLDWSGSASRKAAPSTADRLRRARLLQRQGTPQSEARAVALVEEAIKDQPDHAASHLLLATLYGNQGNRLLAESPALYAKALSHGLRAVALDPADVDAVVMAHWYRYLNDLDGRSALTTAQALAANHPDSQRALQVVAALYAHAGRCDEALAAYRRIAEVAPMEVNPIFAAALALLFVCRHAEGLRRLEEVLEMEPQHVYALRWRIATLAALERHDEARARYDELLALAVAEPIDLQCLAAHLAAWRGDLAGCRTLYEQPVLAAYCNAVPLFGALRAAHLGRADEAAALVLAMEAARDGRMAFAMWGLHGRTLRRDPRIEAVCQRLGWRALPA